MHRSSGDYIDLQYLPRPGEAELRTLLALITGSLLFIDGSACAQDVGAQDLARWSTLRQQLVGDLECVTLPGVVGSLCVFGPKSYPIITAVHEDSTRLPIIACAQHGRGRLIACAHGGYVEKDFGDSATGDLMMRLARWASGSDQHTFRFGYLRRRGITIALQRRGHEPVHLPKENWTRELKRLELLVIVGSEITEANVDPIRQFIRDGGGLIVADAAWVWRGYRKQQGETLLQSFPPNQLLAPLGIVWTGSNVSRDDGAGARVRPRIDRNTHALFATSTLDSDRSLTDQQSDQIRVVIEQAFEALPTDDKLLLPRVRHIASQNEVGTLNAALSHRRGLSDLKQRISVGLETVWSQRQSMTTLAASPMAIQFPGTVPAAAPRIDHTVTIDTSRPRWHSTGMYAAPGEVVTVAFPANEIGKGLNLRVGCHKDRLWHKSSWKRVPEITRTFTIDSPSVEIGNAFGGLIYVEVPKNCRLGSLSVMIRGAVAAPRYQHGVTDLQQWRDSIRGLPGPWAEIASDKIVFTVPAAAVRNLDDPNRVMDYWNEVMDHCADLAMIDPDRESPERFVCDAQISAGYMHAGYPIMAPLSLAREVIDIDTLRERGNWGVFHEIGHNHQEPDWTYAGMGEVTVNLFSLYVFDRMHPAAKKHRQVQTDRIKEMIADFESTQRREGPWVNLVPYIQLQKQFGWQSYRDVFDEYRRLSKDERPRSDLEKRSQWMTRFSNRVGRNLSPFFQYWRIETTDESKAEVADLPAWSGPERS